MTFHFKQDCDSKALVQGVAILDDDEYIKLRACPQCDRPAPTYGDSGWVYFVECPKCSLRIKGRPIHPNSICCLRNAVRYHKRALQSAVNNWNERANAKGEAPWPKSEEPPLDHIW